MTIGLCGDYTWRYRLWHHLRDHRVPARFVGPHAGVYDPRAEAETPAGYRDPRFDTAHHAAWGRPMPALTATIATDLRRHRPDYLLLMAGLIDLGFYTLADVTEAALRDLLGHARAAAPALRVVLAPVPVNDRTLHDELFAAQCRDYNTRLRRVADELTTPAAPVLVTEALTDWHLPTDTNDGTHPSPEGEHKIAAAFADVLHRGFGLAAPYRSSVTT